MLSVTILMRGTVFSLIEASTSDDGCEGGNVDGDGYGPLEPVTDSLRECYLEQLALYGEVEISTQGDEDSNIGNA